MRTVSRSRFFAANSSELSSPLFSRSHFLASLLAAVSLAAGSRLTAAADDNILLDFTATWCGPCQQMSPIVSKLERQGYPIRKVDVDKEPGLAARFKVESIPTFILVSDGQEKKRAMGITSEQQLISMMNMLQKAPAIAKTAPEKKKSQWEAGPRLGAAIPIKPDENKPPRRALPVDPTPAEELASVPDSFDQIAPRGQSPEISPASSSVRIRVKDGTSVNYGSGTIIDSQPGRATILSCGHIFRKLSKNAVIEIDLYHGPKGTKPDMVPGRVLLTDLEADVGLVTINFPGRLPTMPLGLSRPLAVGEKLFSIGCSGGDNPSRENLELTALNKYRGPENLECTHRPQRGRSGGGLFRDEELVGVCIAADPDKPLGLYTGLQPIALLLEKAGLTHVLPRAPKASQAIAATEALPAEMTEPIEEAPTPVQLVSSEADLHRLLDQSGIDAGLGASTGGSVPQDFAGAEVICIVRSKTPGKPSRIVIVNQASERFVADLLHESGGDSARQPEVKTANRTSVSNESQGPIETSLKLQQSQRTTENCDPKTGTCPLPGSRGTRTPSKSAK